MPEYIIHIREGKILNKITLRNAFKSLNTGAWLVKIDSVKKRSLSQNNYYWGCVVPLVLEGLRDIGYAEIKTHDDAHETMKFLFLKKQIPNENTGEVIEILGSTAKLTTVEFIDFIDQVLQWAAEYLGIQIPLPNEQLQMSYS